LCPPKKVLWEMVGSKGGAVYFFFAELAIKKHDKKV
jgi:hypothetical protein